MSDSTETNQQKIPLALKIVAALFVFGGVAALPELVRVMIALVGELQTGTTKVSTLVVFGILIVLLTISAVTFIIFGLRILRNKRKHAAHAAYTLVAVTILVILADMMLFGINLNLIGYGIELAILIALMSYLDPTLAEERALQRKIRKMNKEEQGEAERLAEEARPKKGYITLNFFNIFWIFVVCCVLGLLLEDIFHIMKFGEYQDRAGMLFGPFSPIYGFGAVLMTVALNRFHDKPLIVIFLVSAVIGGGFEFFTSWIMEFAFGIRAWDYSGTFLSIDGRTNAVFMVAWGALGIMWIKLLLPRLLKFINMIPWNWRYGVTVVCAVFMLINGLMSLQSIDCWYQRMSGNEPSTPIQQFYANHYDDDYMANRFQTMTMNPEDATRVK
ncbi:MAG: putative ABC transporter permease [Raoultibacter sp.]